MTPGACSRRKTTGSAKKTRRCDAAKKTCGASNRKCAASNDGKTRSRLMVHRKNRDSSGTLVCLIQRLAIVQGDVEMGPMQAGAKDQSKSVPLAAEVRRREMKLLLILASVQFTSIVDFMVVMPLGPQLQRKLHIDNCAI